MYLHVRICMVLTEMQVVCMNMCNACICHTLYTSSRPPGDGGNLYQIITELTNYVLAYSKQMMDFSHEVRGQLDTINDTVNTLQGQLESLAEDVTKNKDRIKDMKKIAQSEQEVSSTLQEQLQSLAGDVMKNGEKINNVTRIAESEQEVSKNLSAQLATTTDQLSTTTTQLSNGLNRLRRELTASHVLAHNLTQAQLETLHISLQQQCRQTSLEALQDSLAAHTSQLANATEQLYAGHQALEDGLTEQLQTVSSDCDNRTAELLQGQQTVLERLHGIEKQLGHMHTCEGIAGWRGVALHTHSAVQVYCNNETGQTEYKSCGDANLFGLPSGTYTIRPSGGSPVTVYCDMDREECGGGGWTRVASYTYNDPNISCPTNWTQITDPFRGCALTGAVKTNNCASTLFSTLTEFNQVCGEVFAIQQSHPAAFYYEDNIDSDYVEGVSITHGTPRQHIWTFAAYPSDDSTTPSYLCPCSRPSQIVPPPPSFVGSNYFCDTAAETRQDGWHLDDPLWDGKGCPSTSTCCSFNNPPWFIATLPQHTSDDIEVRICERSDGDDDTAIILLNLYVR